MLLQKKNNWNASLHFFSLSQIHIKCRASKNNFPRLKVQSYRINGSWSGDLAYVHQLAKDNDGKKLLLVFVDCRNRLSRVGPIDNMSAIQTRAALAKMAPNQKPEKNWVDKGNELKGQFAKLCLEKNITVYSTHSDQKSCFAERYIRTLDSILFKYLHEKTRVSTFLNFKTLSAWSIHVPVEQPKLLPKVLQDTMYLT